MLFQKAFENRCTNYSHYSLVTRDSGRDGSKTVLTQLGPFHWYDPWTFRYFASSPPAGRFAITSDDSLPGRFFYFFLIIYFFCKAASNVEPYGLFWQPALVRYPSILYLCLLIGQIKMLYCLLGRGDLSLEQYVLNIMYLRTLNIMGKCQNACFKSRIP